MPAVLRDEGRQNQGKSGRYPDINHVRDRVGLAGYWRTGKGLDYPWLQRVPEGYGLAAWITVLDQLRDVDEIQGTCGPVQVK